MPYFIVLSERCKHYLMTSSVISTTASSFKGNTYNLNWWWFVTKHARYAPFGGAGMNGSP